MENELLTKKPLSARKNRVAKRFLEVINAFEKTKILVVGDFILDEFVWGKVSRISPEAPVPVVNINRQEFVPGGALNVSNNIRELKGTVFPCGVLGKDLYGRMLLKKMRENGIETGGVVYEKGRRTTLKTRVVAHSQQVVRFDREDTDDISHAATRHILSFVRQRITQVQVLVIEDYGKGVITPMLLKSIAQLAKKHGVTTIVDPKEKHFDYYRGMNVITPNLREAVAAARKRPDEEYIPLEEVGRRLLARFKCKAAVVTLGEKGMCIFEQSRRVTHIPTAAREVFDVSGAGDTVVAVLAMALSAGASIKEAATLANLAAGVVVGKLGTATVTPEEFKSSVANHRTL